MTGKPRTDWEAIEREYRAGQLSIREIARRFDVSDTAIRKRAKAESWTQDLAEKVRKAVREKLVRGSSQDQRADREIVEEKAEVGFAVVTSHRADIQQLRGLKRIIADRLETYLQGGTPDGPFMGDKESPGDLLEKMSRVTSRLIPLERQAHNLDAEPDAPVTVKVESDAAFAELVGALEGAARARASRTGGASEVDQSGEA
jgi:transposase-like protein